MKILYSALSARISRNNQIKNNFEYGANPKIAAPVVFHHTGVCITSGTVIEPGVHLYRNITFGVKNGGAPHVKRNAKIGSHSVILGKITVGEKAIIAPGSVVVNDVPDFKVAAGVPARVIGDVTDDNYAF